MTINNEKLSLKITKDDLEKVTFIVMGINILESIKKISPCQYFNAGQNKICIISRPSYYSRFCIPIMNLIHDKVLICEDGIYKRQHIFPARLTSNLKHVYKCLNDIYTNYLTDK